MHTLESKPNSSLKEKVLSGLVWTFGERIAAQGISFVLSVILARILMPTEYGIIAMVMVFINIANVFTNGGFGEALIQKQDADEKDFSTMFFCTLAVSSVVYVLLFLLAPFIAKFYREPEIAGVLRILALKIVISSLATIQHAYVQEKMLFRKFFFSTIGGTFFSGILGIILAKAGFGVWALVIQYLANSTIDALVLLFTVEWRPKLFFSKKSAQRLMNFGWRMVLANLVNAIYNELRSIIIGRMYSSESLAYYNKGNQIPALAITNIDTAIGNVVFPAMSAADSPERLKSIGRRSLKTTSYIIFPIMIGLIAVSKPLILLLLTEKWSSCVVYMQILCIYWMTQPIQTVNWQIIKATGKSSLCLKLELIKKSIGIVMVMGAMFISVRAIAISAALFGIISMVMNGFPSQRLIRYSFVEQMKDVIPAFLASTFMGGVVYLVSYIDIPMTATLLLQVFLGIMVYIAISSFFKIEAYVFLLSMIKNKLNK